jgi:hypothetical protein
VVQAGRVSAAAATLHEVADHDDECHKVKATCLLQSFSLFISRFTMIKNEQIRIMKKYVKKVVYTIADKVLLIEAVSNRLSL